MPRCGELRLCWALLVCNLSSGAQDPVREQARRPWSYSKRVAKHLRPLRRRMLPRRGGRTRPARHHLPEIHRNLHTFLLEVWIAFSKESKRGFDLFSLSLYFCLSVSLSLSISFPLSLSHFFFSLSLSLSPLPSLFLFSLSIYLSIFSFFFFSLSLSLPFLSALSFNSSLELPPGVLTQPLYSISQQYHQNASIDISTYDLRPARCAVDLQHGFAENMLPGLVKSQFVGPEKGAACTSVTPLL